ncbi:hypothetical protein AUJ14_02915 [Candidatus Micrarchaeota archaeon CG1_02_55_22]|nr:MAG: hypothetical protein AUJ14_02915 [Candidatus Micrarchaeota archaeon CG1_02_55_22]
MKKVAFVLGTRAEAIKMLSIIRALERKGHDYKVLSTGQHDLTEFKFKNFVELTPPKGKSGMFSSKLGAITFLLRNTLKLRPLLKDCIVIVQGDTMSTMAGAVAGRLASGALVCHVESGLRTGDYFAPFPEEISRVVTDNLARLHFAPTQLSARNTPNSSTFVVGNTVIDELVASGVKPDEGDKVIVSIHRQENINDRKVMVKLVDAVEELALVFPVTFILANNTKRKLEEYGLLDRITQACRTEPVMPYNEFVKLLASCRAVLSDSGGLAEECSFLGKPLMIFRTKTERMEAVNAGNALLGFQGDFISFIKSFKTTDEQRKVFGDGNAGEKIVGILEGLEK